MTLFEAPRSRFNYPPRPGCNRSELILVIREQFFRRYWVVLLFLNLTDMIFDICIDKLNKLPQVISFGIFLSYGFQNEK